MILAGEKRNPLTGQCLCKCLQPYSPARIAHQGDAGEDPPVLATPGTPGLRPAEDWQQILAGGGRAMPV